MNYWTEHLVLDLVRGNVDLTEQLCWETQRV